MYHGWTVILVSFQHYRSTRISFLCSRPFGSILYVNRVLMGTFSHNAYNDCRTSFQYVFRGRSAKDGIEPKRTLGPYSGVSTILFTPNVPSPASKAACLWEKIAMGFSTSTWILPYPSLGTKTEAFPLSFKKLARRYVY